MPSRHAILPLCLAVLVCAACGGGGPAATTLPPVSEPLSVLTGRWEGPVVTTGGNQGVPGFTFGIVWWLSRSGDDVLGVYRWSNHRKGVVRGTVTEGGTRFEFTMDEHPPRSCSYVGHVLAGDPAVTLLDGEWTGTECGIQEVDIALDRTVPGSTGPDDLLWGWRISRRTALFDHLREAPTDELREVCARVFAFGFSEDVRRWAASFPDGRTVLDLSIRLNRTIPETIELLRLMGFRGLVAATGETEIPDEVSPIGDLRFTPAEIDRFFSLINPDE